MDNYYSYILSKDIGSTLFLLIPALILIFAFFHFKKKKELELKKENRFGRRGRKDHAWQIIKEYHKTKNDPIREIEEYYFFERPEPQNFHDALVRGLQFRDKEKAKREGIKYKKIKYPERIDEIEDYFEALDKETYELNASRSQVSNKIEDIRKNRFNNKGIKRKRYVILYKKKEVDIESQWQGIEVELVKKSDTDGKMKDSVLVNKELDVDKERLWLEPLLVSKLEDKKKQEEIEKKRLAKKKGKS